MAALGDRLKLMVKTFRRECHRMLESERTTIHGADGMLQVLQVAMAEVSKQLNGEFRVALSDVLMAWKHLLLDKLHLPPPSSARLENYDLILDAYESFLKRSNTLDLVDVLSMYKQLKVVDSDPEEPVGSIQLFEVLSGNMEVPEGPNSPVPSTPSSRSRPCSSQVIIRDFTFPVLSGIRPALNARIFTSNHSDLRAQCEPNYGIKSGLELLTCGYFEPEDSKVKTAVRRVFCSYLSLLVNSKNDLALALTLDVPCRSLGQQAFTDIKHAARSNKTSLFLAVTSFIRAIQLGGKGYAPAESDPLRKHVKGLSDYVQFLDNLEEILGETPDPSECGARLLTAIRAVLVKGRSSGDAVHAAAEETTKELKERILQLHQIQKQATNDNRTGISPARPKAYAVNHATAYGGRDTVKVLVALLDEEALAPPCPNKADLLSEDQPALSGAEGTCVLMLFRSPEVPTGCSPEPLRNRVQSRLNLLKPKARDELIRSQFACTYKEEELPLNRTLDFLSTSQAPTCVHPAPKPKMTQSVDDERSLDMEDATTGAEAKRSTSPSQKKPQSLPGLAASPSRPVDAGKKEPSEAQREAALEQRSGNAQNAGAGARNKKKTGIQMQNKRKQLDCDQHSGSENQPPEKKRHSCVKVPSKNACKASNKKEANSRTGEANQLL